MAEAQSELIELMRQQMEQMRIAQEHMMQVTMENQQLKQELAAANGPGNPQTKRPDRPSVEADLTDNDWAIFIDSWSRYKEMTRLTTVNDIRNELRATCAPSVNKMLFDLVGSTTLNTSSEEELLGHMHRVAVRGVHKEVHRQRFTRITQVDGESVNKFVARLKAQATLCDFKVRCNNPDCGRDVSYSEEMVSHQMVSGLSNAQHQSKILAEAATISTFQEKFDKLISLETTDNSTPQLNITPAAMMPTVAGVGRSPSEYKRRLNASRDVTKRGGKYDNDKETSNRRCKGCGNASHLGKTMARKDCPAFGKKCNGCGIENHFRKVCRTTKSKNAGARGDETSGEDDFDDEYESSVSFALGTEAYLPQPDFRTHLDPNGPE